MVKVGIIIKLAGFALILSATAIHASSIIGSKYGRIFQCSEMNGKTYIAAGGCQLKYFGQFWLKGAQVKTDGCNNSSSLRCRCETVTAQVAGGSYSRGPITISLVSIGPSNVTVSGCPDS